MTAQRFFILTAAFLFSGCAGQTCIPWQGHPKSNQANTEEAYRHKSIGDSLYSQGRFSEAEEEFRKAIELNLNLPEIHYKLGFSLDMENRHAEAEAEFREAIRINSDYADAYYLLGLALISQGQNGEAKAELKKASELYERQGDKEKAEDIRNYIKSLERKEKIERAKKETERGLVALVELNPQSAEAHLALARFLLWGWTGKTEEAEKELQEAIRLKPELREQPEVRVDMALLLLTKGQHEEAEKELQEALKSKPDLPEAHLLLWMILDSQDKKDEAKVEFDKAMELYEKQGRKREAELWRKLAELFEEWEKLTEW